MRDPRTTKPDQENRAKRHALEKETITHKCLFISHLGGMIPQGVNRVKGVYFPFKNLFLIREELSPPSQQPVIYFLSSTEADTTKSKPPLNP